MGHAAISAQINETVSPLYDFPELDNKAAYPTMQALETAVVPTADRYAIAARLRKIDAPHSVPPRVYAIGDARDFFVVDTSRDVTQSVTAELLAIGEHIYVWVETGYNVTQQSAADFARAFDTQVYEQVRALWGSEPMPGIDGDPRIFALFTGQMNPYTAAYFTSQHTYPRSIEPNSNEHEMLIFNLSATGTSLNNGYVLSTASHEFQHMIRHHVDLDEVTWMDEGFASLTEHLLGMDDKTSTAMAFVNNPSVQLNDWGKGSGSHAQYGASMLFLSYFEHRYGREALQQLSSSSLSDLQAVDAVLRSMDQPNADVFFADWVLANLIQQPDTTFGYASEWDTLTEALSLMTVTRYPHQFGRRLSQYATDYYTFVGLDAAGEMEIEVETHDIVPLVPLIPASGEWFVYSNKGDESNPRLTREFDLTQVDAATLQYSVWTDLEDLWDYGYVTISTDGGATWQLLSTPEMTDKDPHGRASGSGYTGATVQWIEQQISLDKYAGQRVQIRFEVVTDDAVNGDGLALDDVRIPEIGYTQDFEAGDDGWHMEGFMRIDNRLPQRAWVQAVQFSGDTFNVERWLIGAGEDTSTHQLQLNDGIERVVVAVSPFAPLTTQPMRYSINVNVR